MNLLRERLKDLIGADRWIEGAYPIVEPVDTEEIQKILKGFTAGQIIVVGSGTNFPADFSPGKEVIILLTRKIRQVCEIDIHDQIIEVSCGFPIQEVNEELKQNSFIVPALSRFNKGTIGGRLASVSSRPAVKNDNGWMQSLLGIDIVLSSGELLTMGGRNIKDVAGYDMKYLFTGSRGAIGVISKAIFRCRPLSSYKSAYDKVDTGDAIPLAGSLDKLWKNLFDPIGRMQRGA